MRAPRVVRTTERDFLRMVSRRLELGHFLPDILKDVFGEAPRGRMLDIREKVLDFLSTQPKSDEAGAEDDDQSPVIVPDPGQLFLPGLGPDDVAREIYLRLSKPANRYPGDTERYIAL